ncbi:MAG: thermonuclease family protein [Acidobacteria bacterium]|nr:thermonuclease family protein [Acidobacteriota bacterium]
MLSFKRPESAEAEVAPRWQVGIEKERVALFVGIALIGGFVLGFASARFINRTDALKAEDNKAKSEESSRAKLQAPAAALPLSAKVTRVLRGDTIEVEGIGTVHMIGVETPDGKKPVETYATHGKNALNFTEKALLNREVRLEYDPAFAAKDNKDASGQTLAYIYTMDGTLFNAELLRQGHAFAQVSEPFKMVEDFRSYEREGMTAMRGLWGMDGASSTTAAATPPPSATSPSATTPNKPGRLSPLSPTDIGPNLPTTSGAPNLSPSEPMVYVEDKMYHKAGCELLGKKHQVMSLSQARSSGHVACGRCFASTVMKAP